MIPPSPASSSHLLARLLTGRVVPGSLLVTQITEISENAIQHGLAPMLYWVLDQAHVDLSDPIWQPIISAARQESARYLMRRSAQGSLESALEAAKIPAIWIKGFALAHIIYPIPTLRQMGDLDVMVPYHQRKQALSAVNDVGYHPDRPEMFRGYYDLTHHYPLRGYMDNLIYLEVHFRLLGWDESLLPLSQLDWFWSHTQTYRWQDLSFTSLTPEAHLLYLCAHSILQHGEGEFNLGRYQDIHLLVHNTPAMNWQIVVSQAENLGWTYAVKRALEITQEYYATLLPDQFMEELEQGKGDEQSVANSRRARPKSRLENNLSQFTGKNLRSRLLLIFGLIFPSTDYMRWRYPGPAWRLPLLYLYRWLDITSDALGVITNRVFRRYDSDESWQTTARR